MTKKTIKKKKEKKELTTVSFETFRDIGPYEIGNLTREEPSCFNCIVSVRKYRVTIEPVTEPAEVICARLQHLWETSDNYHDHDPLMNLAAEYNYVFVGCRGEKRETK